MRLVATPSARRAAAWSTCVCLVWLAGCASAARSLSPVEQRELHVRAQTLLLRAAQSELDVIRANAFEALVEIDPDMGRAHFLTGLDAPQPLVRFAACVALGDLRDCAALDEFQRLLVDREQRVQLAAAFAAYRCGEHWAAERLINTLNDDPDEDMRSDAALLIGRLGERRALARLRNALRREKSGKVRTHIHGAMAALGDRKAVDELMNSALGDAVSKLVALQSLAELAETRTSDVLLYCLSDRLEYLETRLIAARALGRIDNSAGFGLALDALRYKGDNPTDTMRTRALAAHALGAIGDPRALDPLGKLAEIEQDPRTQIAACYAICQILGGE